MRMGRLEFVGHRREFVVHVIPLAMVIVRMMSAKNSEESAPW
jgi:hypothetical protein